MDLDKEEDIFIVIAREIAKTTTFWHTR